MKTRRVSKWALRFSAETPILPKPRFCPALPGVWSGDILVDGLRAGRDSLKFTEMKIGYTGSGDMTILPAEAYCGLSAALAEGQTAEDAREKLRAHLDSHGFADVGVWML